jgi:signal transduction histidine kinase
MNCGHTVFTPYADRRNRMIVVLDWRSAGVKESSRRVAQSSIYGMKSHITRLSGRYRAGLRAHLKRSTAASLRSAQALGRQAVALGLETLDLARIHQGVLAKLEGSSRGDGLVKAAELFFAEALTPIEMTHQAALKAGIHLSKLNKTLGRRTVDLAASHRSLKAGIVERKSMEHALRKNSEHSRGLLKESRLLQKHLQRLTHQILSAQEDKRRKISRDLHNEIAQTLLGINIRLLTLKKEAALNAHGLKNEIVSTQRLVDNSVRSIKRFAREFGVKHGK